MSENSIRLPVGLERERRCTDQLVWLKREVQKGIDAVEEGSVVRFDPQDIKRRGRARQASPKKQARG